MKLCIGIVLGVVLVSGCRTGDSGTQSAVKDTDVTSQDSDGSTDDAEIADLLKDVKNGDKLLHVCDDNTEVKKFAFIKYYGLDMLGSARPMRIKGKFGSKDVLLSHKCLEVLAKSEQDGYKPGGNVLSACNETGAPLPDIVNPVTGERVGEKWALMQFSKNWALIRKGFRSGWVARSCLIKPVN